MEGQGQRRQAARGRLVAVGGGKGGVGKSVVSILLARAFAQTGRRVVLADLDLGSGNLHTYLGLHRDAPGMADFLTRRRPALEALRQPTALAGVDLISGARFYPGMANPSYQSKLKVIRHLKALDADVVIVDLGAGVHFNTLDFFAASRPGLLTLAPEPGSVLNAYSFVKGSIFRQLTRVFGRHPDLGPHLEAEGRNDGGFSFERFRTVAARADASYAELLDEIVAGIDMALVMNRVTDLVSALYADNLQKLVLRRLGLRIRYLGNLPRADGLSSRLTNLPSYLENTSAAALNTAAGELVREADRLAETAAGPAGDASPATDTAEPETREAFDDDALETLRMLIDRLAPDALADGSRGAWKLRVYYRPHDVVRLLRTNGLRHPVLEPAPPAA